MLILLYILIGFCCCCSNVQSQNYDIPEVNITERGARNSMDYAIYFENSLGPISPFHDIPFSASIGNPKEIFNMVVEIPRWTNAKMEIQTMDPLNPIKQDTNDDDTLRYISNVFPYHGHIFNYGAVPQTWGNPKHPDLINEYIGDKDLMDICEIGSRVAEMGDILQVKILGVIALIDEGEIDWKLIAIDVNDPMAPALNDVQDVNNAMPGLLDAIVNWFTIYKVPTGKPLNTIAFGGEVKNKEFAKQVLSYSHEQWKSLIEGVEDANGVDISSVTVPFAMTQLSISEATQIVSDSPAPSDEELDLDAEIDIWHFL